MNWRIHGLRFYLAIFVVQRNWTEKGVVCWGDWGNNQVIWAYSWEREECWDSRETCKQLHYDYSTRVCIFSALLLSSPPGLQPPVQLQTAGLHRDLRPAQALVGLHLGLLLLEDPLSRLARALLQTLTVGHHPLCPPGLTAHPQVCPGEWKYERSFKQTALFHTNVFYSVFQLVLRGH